ncbi:4a-hydroxytetrahydrobiopterin dehydratase [Nostoc sp. NIES-2111]
MPARLPLSDSEITTRLQAHPGWAYTNGELVRPYRFASFSEGLGFIVRVGLISEQLDHHARITNVYNRVELAISTHDAGGITEADFAWVQAIDGLSPSV